jgi:CubicO group peptidase (beta-lactamase class C family)
MQITEVGDNMKLSKIFITVFILMVLVSGPLLVAGSAQTVDAATAGDGDFAAIDAFIADQLDTLNIPGASWAFVTGDQIVHTRSIGSGANNQAPTPQTPFFIGSLTKSFTALAVMQLVEAGKVDLDAPVQCYLPWFTPAGEDLSGPVSVRHLLNQTSGLSQIPGMQGLSNFNDDPGAAKQQARVQAQDGLARPAGTAFEYSNSNYNLLGLIVEAVSGETYSDYVQDHIFTPLDMRHSYTAKTAAQQDGLAVGHLMVFGIPIAAPNLPVPVASLPSGQLISSTEDMAHYLIAQLNGGRYCDRQVLSAEGMTRMHTPAAAVYMFGERMPDYGMGWYIDSSGKEEVVMHWGETPDYFSYLALLPEQQLGVVLFVNADQHMYTYPLLDLGNSVVDLLVGEEPADNSWLILPWVLRALLLLPVLQIIGIRTALRRLKRWQVEPGTRPGRIKLWLLDLILPTILNLVVVAMGVGLLVSGLFKFSLLFMGDLVSIILACALMSTVWLVVRTRLMIRILKTN